MQLNTYGSPPLDVRIAFARHRNFVPAADATDLGIASADIL